MRIICFRRVHSLRVSRRNRGRSRPYGGQFFGWLRALSHALSCQLLSLELFLSVEVTGVDEVSPFFAVILFFAPQAVPHFASLLRF